MACGPWCCEAEACAFTCYADGCPEIPRERAWAWEKGKERLVVKRALPKPVFPARCPAFVEGCWLIKQGGLVVDAKHHALRA